MCDGAEDCQDPVNGDDHHDEAGEVEPDHPQEGDHLAGQARCLPQQRVGPHYLRGELEQYHLEQNFNEMDWIEFLFNTSKSATARWMSRRFILLLIFVLTRSLTSW